MTPSEDHHGRPAWRNAAVSYVALLVLAITLCTANATGNPTGFYIDESSIAYNAAQIASTGRDEYGIARPLYFRAFGDYKNPTYIYLLAAIFRVTGPGIRVARLFSATLGVLTVLALALLANSLSKRWQVGLVVGLTTLLTPWLFELSRVVIEVAMYPLLLALFLLCLQRASEKTSWSMPIVIGLASSLALLTYTYSIGRLLGPLFALGLVLFVTRERWRSVLLTWAVFALLLVPLFVFHLRNPGALTGRFKLITFITDQSGYGEIAFDFLKHYAGNLNPWRMLVSGDPNTHQIATVYGVGLLLAPTFALAVAGLVMILRRRNRERWWLFVVYGLAAAVVPASLTKEYFHMLRLAAVPVFMIVLAVPALTWLMENGKGWKRILLVAILAVTLLQGDLFQWQYHSSAHSPWRLHLFDADYPTKILAAALSAASSRPVYLADAPPIPGYIQAFWYGLLQGIPRDKFTLLPADQGAPESAIVITTEDTCVRCRKLAESEPYVVYEAVGAPRVYVPLPQDGFRLELYAVDTPTRLIRNEQATIRVRVRNTSNSVWFARERGASSFQISAGNHWLSTGGKAVINDDGRGPLRSDLHPNEETEISFTVNAPRVAGNYLLEIDMLQEGVSWFAAKGSATLRLPVKVE
jgi:hypothetical protein